MLVTGATHADKQIWRGPPVEPRKIGRDLRHRLLQHVFRNFAVQPEPLRVPGGPDIDAKPLIDLALLPERELRAASARIEYGDRTDCAAPSAAVVAR